MTPTSWRSLYLSCVDSPIQPVPALTPALIAEKLLASLTAAGFVRYDPFALMPTGKVYPHAVKAFVAPATATWIRIVLAPDSALDDALLMAFSASFVDYFPRLILLSTALLDGGAHTQIRLVTPDALITDPQHVRHTLAMLPHVDSVRMLHALTDNYTAASNAHASDIPLNALGGDVSEMAQGVNLRQAQEMFDKLAGKFLKQEDQAAARALLQPQVEWGGAGGQRLQAFMACLPITMWRDPEFVMLRDAYHLHNRQRRSPNARLYPGDAEALMKVPDALDYLPVFAGRL